LTDGTLSSVELLSDGRQRSRNPGLIEKFVRAIAIYQQIVSDIEASEGVNIGEGGSAAGPDNRKSARAGVIKSILVAANGDDADSSVFGTALALAQPLQAHLDFYHVWITPDQAAAREPHVDFAQGRARTDALDRLQLDAESKSALASRSFKEFCERYHISVAEPGEETAGVSAGWLEEKDDTIDRFLFQARHHDLVVVGHPRRSQWSRRGLVAQLLFSSGRPVVIAPTVEHKASGGVAMVGWKETPEAARALAAATPLLVNSPRVILASVEDRDSAPSKSLDDLANQLAWHGVAAETQVIRADGRSIAQLLHAAANDAQADLLIVGAYGHSRIHDLVFGGVTQAFLEGANLPILMAH
jgi:nucleotide-binding universal stress UspA family protein